MGERGGEALREVLGFWPAQRGGWGSFLLEQRREWRKQVWGPDFSSFKGDGTSGGYWQSVRDIKEKMAPVVCLTLCSAHRRFISDGIPSSDLLLLTCFPLSDTFWHLITTHCFHLLREVLPLRDLVKSI